MKPKGVFKLAALACFTGLILSGCCRSMNCDCNFPSVGVFYESDSLSCPTYFGDQIVVTAYNQATNEVVAEPSAFYSYECAIDIYYRPSIYWVITSDTLQFADTLRVRDINLYDPENKCCDCGPQIANITLELGDEVSSGNTIVRKF